MMVCCMYVNFFSSFLFLLGSPITCCRKLKHPLAWERLPLSMSWCNYESNERLQSERMTIEHWFLSIYHKMLGKTIFDVFIRYLHYKRIKQKNVWKAIKNRCVYLLLFIHPLSYRLIDEELWEAKYRVNSNHACLLSVDASSF
jgi:hypothetical protein